MNCKACKCKIDYSDIDNLDAFVERSPIDFKSGLFCTFCFGVLIDEAKDTDSKIEGFDSRMDENIAKDV